MAVEPLQVVNDFFSFLAKGDAFANLRDFQSMRNYDAVFHPIIVGKRVFFGSNVDDTVRCLDAASGKTLWTFTVGGPVRIAPTFHEDKLYFGADDGYAYCVNAETGKLIWRMSPSADADERMVLNNGRLIPFWPCRSGVLVDSGTAGVRRRGGGGAPHRARRLYRDGCRIGWSRRRHRDAAPATRRHRHLLRRSAIPGDRDPGRRAACDR